jgi:hypothetical protein
MKTNMVQAISVHIRPEDTSTTATCSPVHEHYSFFLSFFNDVVIRSVVKLLFCTIYCTGHRVEFNMAICDYRQKVSFLI